jgi:hypothetical protein
MRCEAEDSVLELRWLDMTTTLTAWSLLAVGLAQLGLFRWWALLGISLLACTSGWALWRARRSSANPDRREALFLLLLLGGGLILFARPAEHFPQMGDSSIYPNTASKLKGTGGLTYHYDPLDGLSPEQKELFYVPSDEQLSYIDIQSYEGLLYGAYYVMDPARNTIVSSRPPLAIAWMGLFGLLGGPRGMLYVAPLFGVGSVLVVYFLGRRLFDAGAGALAAVWLLLSFPQFHFSRAPYAEVVGQFFVLTALYALVVYLQTARPRYVLLGVAALTAGFSARLDVVLFVPVLLLFAFFLCLRRDYRGLVACAASAMAGIGFTAWTINRPYVGATGELLLRWQLRFLHRMSPFLLAGAGLAGLLAFIGLVRLLHSIPPRRRHRLVRWGVLLVVVVGVGYALHVRPRLPEYVGVGEEAVATHNEELMAVAARYMSYPFFWLAGLGMIGLFWRRIGYDRLLFAFFVAFFATGFFWKYTTARVYPVALRRLVPEVLPGCALLAAFALRRLAKRGPCWRRGAGALAGLVAVLLVSLSGPYWFHRGASGARRALGEMARHLPSGSVVLFEPREEDSVVGWFAAPLWSFHHRDALLLNADGSLDAEALEAALCHWHDQGKRVYVVSQQDPPTWWPRGFQGDREAEVPWTSSIVGQSLRFPPYVWRFSFTFSIYRLEAPVSCSTDDERATAMLAALD